MALAGRLGAQLDLSDAPAETGLNATSLLYSESASRLIVTVPKENRTAFEALFRGQELACLGETANGPLRMGLSGNELLSEDVANLARAFKATLDW
jgi:phosphoribosylformylglycinamidine synthase